MEFWFNYDETAENEFIGTIVDKGFYNVELNFYELHPTNPKAKLTATANGVSISSSVGSGWNFVALTVKKPDNISLYVNGVLVNSSSGTFVNVDSSSPLVVGSGFKGILDELAFSTTSLDSSVILSDYSKGLGGNDYCSAAGLDSSGTQTEFVIEGCYSPLLVKPAPLNTCSSNGRYLCVNTSVGVYRLIDTTKINNSCKAPYPSAYPDVSLRTDCCPSGMKCSNEGNEGKYICQQRTEVCSDYDNKGDCQANNCFWVVDGDDEFCIENPRDYSCSVYYNSTLCEEDAWNLGQEGVGTEVCGTYVIDRDLDIGYIIPQGSCRCEWDLSKCVLAWDTSPDIYGRGNRDNFTCQKFYNTSACIDGKQTVNWTENNVFAVNARNPASAELRLGKATGPAGRKA